MTKTLTQARKALYDDIVAAIRAFESSDWGRNSTVNEHLLERHFDLMEMLIDQCEDET